jgi:exonuclease-1
MTCARSLAQGEHTTKYITYFMRQVQLLIDQNIRPLIVFDGDDLPAKKQTTDSRRESRLENVRLAEQLEARGLKSEASEHYVRAVGITSTLLLPLYSVLRHHNIPFIVAPYEADAQLAYLCLHGIVDFVITEDSDLLAYQCPTVVFKLDRDGNCESLEYSALFKLEGIAGLNPQTFLQACVLAGCDYLPAIPRMGFRTAVRRMLEHRTVEAVLGGLRAEGRWDVPDGYEERFRKACAIFLQQRVYDPTTGTTVGVHEDCRNEDAGPGMSAEIAKGIAEGLVDPRTRESFGVENNVCKVKGNMGPAIPPRGKSGLGKGKFVPPSLRRLKEKLE